MLGLSELNLFKLLGGSDLPEPEPESIYTTYTSSGIGKVIDADIVEDSITISNNYGLVSKIELVLEDIQHAYVGDLHIRLKKINR